MKNPRLLLAALGCCLLLASALWVRGQAQAAPPLPITTPIATPITTPLAAPNQTAPDDRTTGYGPRPDAPAALSPARVTPAPTDAERPIVLHVRVVTDEATPQPLAGVEVEVEVAVGVEVGVEVGVGVGVGVERAIEAAAAPDTAFPAAPERFTALSDSAGRARFDLGRRAGRDAQVRTALSGSGAHSLHLVAAAEPVEIVLRIANRAAVTGSVVDGTGTGIAGAELLLLPWGDPDGPPPAPRRIGRSGADGRFQLRLAVGGRIGARHDRYGPSPLYLVRPAARAMAATATDVQLVLRPSAALWSGQVVDAAGRALGNARLHCHCANPTPPGAELPAPPQQTATGPDGAFAIGQLVPGTLHYEVRAAGHGMLRGQLTLVAGNNPPAVLRLPPSCTLTGIASGPDGKPIGAARIVASDASGTLATTHTTADGSYRLTDLPAGRLALVAQARRGDGPKLQATDEVELTPAARPTWDPRLLPVAAERQLRSQLVDRGGRPLAGYQLIAPVRGNLAATATSDAEGRFTIGASGEGPIDLRAFAPGRAIDTFADAVWRQLDPTNPPPSLTVPPVAFGTVVGRIETTNRQPLLASISVWHAARGEYVSYRSSADGTFRLGHVPPGRITLHCAAAGMPPYRHPEVVVPDYQVLELPTIVMAAGARLSVVVTDPDGAPATGCELRLHGPDGPVPQTANGGVHSFQPVPAGELQLQVAGRGFATVIETLSLQPGADEQRTVRLSLGVRQRVVVAAPASAGGQVTLRVRRQGQTTAYEASAPVPRGTAGGTAIVPFEVWMERGTYDVTAIGNAGWLGQATVEFEPDRPDVTIELRRGK